MTTQDKQSDAVADTFAYIHQKDVPSWGLGRISNRAVGVNEYSYHWTAGEGTCSYIIDTVSITHHISNTFH